MDSRKPRVFVGSSVESLEIAYAIQNNLQYDCDCSVWTQGIFTLSKSALESLLIALNKYDFGIFVLRNDDFVTAKSETHQTPRDNVIFELGLFIGHLGRNRAFMVVPSNIKDLHLPSDLLGIKTAQYDTNTAKSANWETALGRASNDIRKEIKHHGVFSISISPNIPELKHLISMQDVYQINTFVGFWSTVHTQAIKYLADQSDVSQIDVLACYRIGEIRRALDEFKKRHDTKLRVCFANMWDRKLADAYKRKFFDRTPKYMQRAVQESIQHLIGSHTLSANNKGDVSIKDVVAPPESHYDIRLTSQRITFGFYRIDDCIFLVPLDMKKSQNPPPFAWVLYKDSSAPVFNNYLTEFEAMFNESKLIYTSRKQK